MKKLLDEIFDELWPINRSISGPGLRESLEVIKKYVPINITEIPSGSQAFDWTIPKEWSVQHGVITDCAGNKIIDFADNNLHVVSHSESFEGRVHRDELIKHLHFDSNRPEAIPYRTAYYSETWGFCCSYSQFLELSEEYYYVDLATTKTDGHLSYGELTIQGEKSEKILFTSYPCHPSLANNELSGILAMIALIKMLMDSKVRNVYTLTFVFTPETIGDLVYLQQNWQKLKAEMISGAVISMVGNEKPLTVEPAFSNLSLLERMVALNVFNKDSRIHLSSASPKKRMAQRQYASLGIGLPLSAISRAFGGSYPEYHSSLDTKDAISYEKIIETAEALFDLIKACEKNKYIKSLKPFGEPFLSKYNLGSDVAGKKITRDQRIIKIILQNACGEIDLLDMAKLAECTFEEMYNNSVVLEKAALVQFSSTKIP